MSKIINQIIKEDYNSYSSYKFKLILSIFDCAENFGISPFNRKFQVEDIFVHFISYHEIDEDGNYKTISQKDKTKKNSENSFIFIRIDC